MRGMPRVGMGECLIGESESDPRATNFHAAPPLVLLLLFRLNSPTARCDAARAGFHAASDDACVFVRETHHPSASMRFGS